MQRIKGIKISDIDGELHVVAKLECKTMSKVLGVKRRKQQQRSLVFPELKDWPQQDICFHFGVSSFL